MNADYTTLIRGCFKLLSIRPRSQKEIIDYLRKKTTDENLINKVLEQLKSAKFLDDAEFAKWVIDSRSRTRPRGKRLLLQELKSKGIELSTLNSQFSTLNELELAQNALLKKHKSWSKLSAFGYRQKAIRYLQARGFSWNTIETVIRKGYNMEDVN